MTPSRQNSTDTPSLLPLSGRRIARIAAVVVVTVLLVGSGLWWWIATTGLEPKDRSAAQLNALQIALSIGIASGGLFALYLAYRRQAHQEIVARLTDHDASERRVTELYTKAVDQLGSDQAPVRLGGLYALERLAQANPSQKQTIVNVICAYLRMPYTLPGNKPSDDAAEKVQALYNERTQQREVRLTAQRILTANLSPERDAGTFWPEINLNLRGALLIDWSLSGCLVRNAVFADAQFTGGATFKRAQFTSDAWFSSAQFTSDAWFSSAQFTGDAWFIDAQFTGDASFSDAQFTGYAPFIGAKFTGDASFSGARFMRGVPIELGAHFAASLAASETEIETEKDGRDSD